MRLAQMGADPRALTLRVWNDSFLRNGAIYLAGSLAAGLLGYVFHFVTGRLLGPSAYADVAAVVAALYIVSLPALVVQTVTSRFVSLAVGRGQDGSISALLLRMTGASAAFGLAGVVVLAALAPVVARYLQLPRPQLVYVLALAGLMGLLVTVNRGALQGLRRFWALSVNTTLDFGVRVVAAAALIVSGLGALGGILALLAGPVVAYAQSFLLVRQPRDAAAGQAPSLSEVGSYALSAAVAAVGVVYLFNADILLAKHYLPAQAAGVYAAGAVLGRVSYFVATTVAGVMFPEVTTLHARNQAHFHVVDTSLLVLGLVAVGLVGAYLLLPGLVLLPFGHGYDAVRPYLVPFAVGLGMLGMSNLLINYFLSINSRRFAPPLVVACLLETALIVRFHDGVAQIVTMLLIAMTALAAMMAGLYLFDRVRQEG